MITLLNDYIAREYLSDPDLQQQRFVSKLRIGGAKQELPTKSNSNVVFERPLQIDFGYDAEALKALSIIARPTRRLGTLKSYRSKAGMTS